MKTINKENFHGNYIDLDVEYIPYQKLIFNPENYLKKNRPYYFYCKKGHKSSYVVESLEKKGYNVTKII